MARQRDSCDLTQRGVGLRESIDASADSREMPCRRDALESRGSNSANFRYALVGLWPYNAKVRTQLADVRGWECDGPLLDLTIIVASYSTRDLLQSCLESVYRYTDGISFEVICIDDASPHRSADMPATQVPQVILVRNSERRLYARNRNVGMGIALGRFACQPG